MTTSAIARPVRAAKPRHKAPQAPTKTEQTSYASLFSLVAKLLIDASCTDEPESVTGESDRLLSVASFVAESAPADEAPCLSQNRAFDIAACINAARLVPGDTESAERSAYLAQVGVILAEIAETTPDNILRTNVPRPALTRTVSATTSALTTHLTSNEVSAMHFEAMARFGCAKDVLDLYAEHAGNALIYGIRDLLSYYHNQADTQEQKAETLGDLSAGILPDLSCSLENLKSIIGHANIEGGLDDGVLHAVSYLLQSAKEIADGERYEAKEVGNA